MNLGELLITGRPLDWIVEKLGTRFTVSVAPDGIADLPDARLGGVVAVAVFGGGMVDEPVLARLPALRGVVNFGVGYDRIDVAAAARRGLPVGYLPGTTAGCVADHAWALLLALGRRVVSGHAFVTSGEWLERRFPLTRRVSGRRLGIYGMGAIGSAIAKRAAGFDMEIAYHNRRARTDTPHRYVGSLRELAAWADILAIACPATPETIGSVDDAVLAALGPEGLIINIARGSIVDEDALVAALDGGRIAGAGLDVFAVEPTRPDRLIGRENVVLTPHCAGGTQETWTDTVNRLHDNLVALVETGAVLDPVPGTRASGGPSP